MRRYLLIFLLALLLVGAAWMAWIFVAMNGGVYGIVSSMKSRPDPDSPDLKRKVTQLKEQIRAEFSRVNEGFAFYETSTQDTCYDGANNWKHQDGFAHRCTFRVANFHGFDGDFRKVMLDLERRLFAAGWRSNIHDMQWTLAHDDAAGQDNAATPNHTVDQLPNPYSYYKGGLTLDIGWAERASSRLFDLKNIQGHAMGWLPENIFRDQRKPVDAADVFRKVTQDHRYVVAIAISGHYFEN